MNPQSLSILFFLSVVPNAFALTLVEDNKPACVILLPEKPDKTETEGAQDLAEFIRKMSLAEVPILQNTSAVPQGMNVLRVGASLAEPVKDLLGKVSDSESGFIIAVRDNTLFLAGQSPLATSFACSDLLERLGCRWFIPGELGEVYPRRKTITYDGPDVAERPDFNPRWFRVDGTWSRRNKLGGTGVPAAHSFSNFVNSKEFADHPEWFPLIGGKRVPGGQLCLSNPEVIQRFIGQTRAYFQKTPNAEGMSLGPNDGMGWCECGPCQAMDSGRPDPFAQTRDVVDRQVKMMNAVAAALRDEFPGKKYGFYVYSNHQMPPVTVKPDPSIVPVFAPINTCRLHSLFNPLCTLRQAVHGIYEGWAPFGLEMHYRGYTFNLAGLQGPFHCFHKWIEDMPWMRERGFQGFFPESIESWSASAPQYYLMARLAWRVRQDPQAILREFCDGLFGGPSGELMDRYFWRMADALKNANYHTGNDTNYPDIYTPEIMAAGQKDLQEAASLAQTDREKKCVRIFQLAHDYLQAFLDMQRYQDAFEFAQSKEALDRFVGIRDELIRWDPRFLSDRAAKGYLRRFWGPAVEQSFEKTTGGNELVAKFPDEWQFMLDPYEAGEWMRLYSPDVVGGNWSALKTYSESWNDQGLGLYKGFAWYRTSVEVPERFKGRKIFLWFAAVDEAVKVWVNGKLITYEMESKDKEGNVKKETLDTLRGSWRPLEVEVTHAIRFGAANTLVAKAINLNLDEVGTGGILKIVMLYSSKPE